MFTLLYNSDMLMLDHGGKHAVMFGLLLLGNMSDFRKYRLCKRQK